MPGEFQVTERSRVQLFGNRGNHRKDGVYAAMAAGQSIYKID
jgi:hypothetical protein